MTQDETEVPRSQPPGIDLLALPLTGVREPETTCAKPMPSHRRRFDGRPDQVLLARQFVVSALVEDSPIRDVARLLVSEVTTNALRHTASGTAGEGSGSAMSWATINCGSRSMTPVRTPPRSAERTTWRRPAVADWNC